MENNTIKGWIKTLRSVRRLYHSLNNYRMKSKDADFREFSLLEYATVLPEEVKDLGRLQYIKQLELAKKGYIDKDLKALLVSSKQKERFINHDHKTIPIGSIRVMEGENLLGKVQFGFNPTSDSYSAAHRNHDNIPLWKPYDGIKLNEHFASLHPERDSKLQFEHIFFDIDVLNIGQEKKNAIYRFYNEVVRQSFHCNTYFKNGISSPNEDLLLNPKNYLNKQFYLLLSKEKETIMTLTEATDRYFVFQSFMETAPKPESIYFNRQEFKERFLYSGISLIARLKYGLHLGVQNGILHIGKLDKGNRQRHLRWENFESRLHSSTLSAKEKYYLSNEIITKKNFLVEKEAISLKSDTTEAQLKKHYGTGQWHFAEVKKNQEEMNYRPVDDSVLRHINDRYSQSRNFRVAVAQLHKQLNNNKNTELSM